MQLLQLRLLLQMSGNRKLHRSDITADIAADIFAEHYICTNDVRADG